MRTKKPAHPVSRWRFVAAAMLLAGGLGGFPTLLAQDFTEPEEEITENKVTTWVGNTFGGVWDGELSKKRKSFGNRRGHVPMGIDAIAVADDGTVYTKAQQPDESHKQYGIFTKNGDDLGQFGWKEERERDINLLIRKREAMSSLSTKITSCAGG